MAKSDLLKEAIADAKAVKETALANAKIALQEAFGGRMKSMLAQQLTNEIEGDEEEMPAAEPEMDMEAGEQGMEGEEGMDNDFNWTDDHLSAEVGGNEYDFTVGMGEEEEEMPEEMPAPEGEEDMNAEYNEGMYNMEEELDLQEIIRELEEDMDMDMPAEEEDIDAIAAEGMYSENEHDGMMGESIDEIIEAILREEGEEEMPAEAPAMDDVEAMEEALEAKDEELTEAYNTVKQLKSIINEVNLLNAKLLFTNKLFRNFELSENQKMKVIENFDRASNTREVKLVFTTLAESFKRPTMKKRVVKESYASKATATTAPAKETTQVLTEGFELANRWKKLAGLL
jgi:hypothetical protein